MIYDLLIVGGGPAGCAAGVYAGRKKIKTALITESFGGQSVVAADIQNWIGDKSVSGFELAKKLEEHVRAYDVEIIDGDVVEKVKKKESGFLIKTKLGKGLETKTVLIVSGGRYRKLGIPGEDKYAGKGISYCATCDAPLFKDKVVAVVGGGNAGVEAARDILSYATKVYFLGLLDKITGDPITFEKVKKDSRVEVITMAQTKEILGNDFVTGLKYIDKNTNKEKELKLSGVFVEIGEVPNSEIVKDLVKLNKKGEIEVDHKTQQSSQGGIWAAGDVCDALYKQNNTAAGDAIKATLNIYEYLKYLK